MSWVAQVAAAGIFLQTLFFKLTGAPESVYIFTTIGMEPAGRYGSAVAEALAAALLLWPRMARWGAALGLAVISGAIFFHLTKLGLVVQDDGGLLFGLALTVFICCGIVVYLRWPRGRSEAKGPSHQFL